MRGDFALGQQPKRTLLRQNIQEAEYFLAPALPLGYNQPVMQNAHIDNPPGQERWPDVTGVILAGGKSSRMGRDKATLEVAGMPLFERILAVMRTLFPTVLIAGDRPDLARPEVPCYPDLFPGSALGGLHTGLCAAQTDWIFVAPCDLPHPDAELMRILLRRRTGADVVVPRTRSGLEPLFALYRQSCRGPVQSMLEADQFRIYDFYPQVRMRYVEEGELPADWQRSLANINTPEDIRRLEKEQ